MDLFEQFIQISPKAGSYTVVPLGQHRLGKTIEGYPVFFVATCDDASCVQPINLEFLSVHFEGNCKIISIGEDEKVNDFVLITFSSVNSHLQRYFIEIFSMMLSSLPELPSHDSVTMETEKLVTIFHSLDKPPLKKIQGLWAELLVIEQAKNSECVARAWHNNPSSKYDFTLGEEKIEVKSTSSDIRKHHFSLDQLNPSVNSKLLVASIIVRESSQGTNGLSVQNLLSKIMLKISSVDVKIHVNRVCLNTLGTDYEKSESMFFDYVGAVDSLQYYLCENVPKISKDDVPKCVSEVKFSSDLTNLASFNKGDVQSTENGLINALL